MEQRRPPPVGQESTTGHRAAVADIATTDDAEASLATSHVAGARAHRGALFAVALTAAVSAILLGSSLAVDRWVDGSAVLRAAAPLGLTAKQTLALSSNISSAIVASGLHELVSTSTGLLSFCVDKSCTRLQSDDYSLMSSCGYSGAHASSVVAVAFIVLAMALLAISAVVAALTVTRPLLSFGPLAQTSRQNGQSKSGAPEGGNTPARRQSRKYVEVVSKSLRSPNATARGPPDSPQRGSLRPTRSAEFRNAESDDPSKAPGDRRRDPSPGGSATTDRDGGMEMASYGSAVSPQGSIATPIARGGMAGPSPLGGAGEPSNGSGADDHGAASHSGVFRKASVSIIAVPVRVPSPQESPRESSVLDGNGADHDPRDRRSHHQNADGPEVSFVPPEQEPEGDAPHLASSGGIYRSTDRSGNQNPSSSSNTDAGNAMILHSTSIHLDSSGRPERRPTTEAFSNLSASDDRVNNASTPASGGGGGGRSDDVEAIGTSPREGNASSSVSHGRGTSQRTVVTAAFAAAAALCSVIGVGVAVAVNRTLLHCGSSTCSVWKEATVAANPTSGVSCGPGASLGLASAGAGAALIAFIIALTAVVCAPLVRRSEEPQEG